MRAAVLPPSTHLQAVHRQQAGDDALLQARAQHDGVILLIHGGSSAGPAVGQAAGKWAAGGAGGGGGLAPAAVATPRLNPGYPSSRRASQCGRRAQRWPEGGVRRAGGVVRQWEAFSSPDHQSDAPQESDPVQRRAAKRGEATAGTVARACRPLAISAAPSRLQACLISQQQWSLLALPSRMEPSPAKCGQERLAAGLPCACRQSERAQL